MSHSEAIRQVIVQNGHDKTGASVLWGDKPALALQCQVMVFNAEDQFAEPEFFEPEGATIAALDSVGEDTPEQRIDNIAKLMVCCGTSADQGIATALVALYGFGIDVDSKEAVEPYINMLRDKVGEYDKQNGNKWVKQQMLGDLLAGLQAEQ